ncbi:MAG: hypothetical protein J5800_02870 [Spirochaetales bacterium]|nr:hypothetical protein [Spirochaetales bacterium]
MGLFSRKIKIDYKVKGYVDNLLADAKKVSSDLADGIKTDLQLFLLKQIAADGQVAKEEVQFINGYLDMNTSVDWVVGYLNKYIRDLRNYTLPDTIKKLVYVYTEFGKKEPDEIRDLYMEMIVNDMERFLLVMVILCKSIIAIDGDVSDEEIDGLNQIITSSSDYIENKLGFVPKGVEAARRELIDR